MKTKIIARKFDCDASKYDSQRECFIPLMEEYYSVGIKLLADIGTFDDILDLGAGTGLLSQYLCRYFPEARYTLIDVSRDMVKIAQQRFADQANFQYIIGDYTSDIPDKRYDLIASSLSIHHLPAKDKIKLYRKLYSSLTGSGCFLNIDQYNSESNFINKLYSKSWTAYIENSGICKADLQKALLRKKLDKETTIEREIAQLKEAGFKDVECVYKYMKFGVMIAKAK